MIVLILLNWVLPASTGAAEKRLTKEAIIQGAKKEGKVAWATNLVDDEVREVNKAFQKEFPFIKVEYGRIRGIEEHERIISEMQAKIFSYDMIHVTDLLVNRYLELKVLHEPIDWSGLFGVEPRIVHPKRFGVTIGTTPAGITYNKHKVPKDRIPKRWDDCVDPFFAGKLALEVRPSHFMSVMAGYGEEWTLEFAKKIAANKPKWMSGTTAADTLVAAGEVLIQCPASYASWYRQASRKPTFPVEFVFPEGPILASPSLLLSPLKGSSSPNAAILLTGWLATKGLYVTDTGRETVLDPGTRLGKEFKRMNREVKVASWELMAESDKKGKKILEAWGFPKPER
jgi:iron(III) transport system substrate-binding protein